MTDLIIARLGPPLDTSFYPGSTTKHENEQTKKNASSEHKEHVS